MKNERFNSMKKFINKKIIFFLGIIVIIYILNKQYGWSNYLLDMNNIYLLKNLVRENFFFASIIYIVFTIIGCVVLCLPGITFAVFAGIIFGPLLGILLCLIATTIGAAGAFLVGRFFLKDSIKPMIEKNKYLKKILFSESGNTDIIVLMITRIVPIFPYNLQNFAYGITNISFFKYTLYTFIFMFPGVSFITIGSAGITANENKSLYFLIAIILFIFVFFIGNFIKKKYLR